jgi:glucose-6-phosphate isomerase
MNSELLRFDPRGALAPGLDVSAADIRGLAGRLEAARREVLEVDISLFRQGGPIPTEKEPLDTAFIEWPNQQLAAYQRDRMGSELGRTIGLAKRLRDAVDRVVVLGIGGSYMGAAALKEACCQPYFNELSRADRGGRPRMYFEGNNLDNDAAQGLLHLLKAGPARDALERSWAIVVISKSGGTIETAVALRVFLRALREQLPAGAALGDFVVPVTGASGKLAALADALGCRERFAVPDGVGGRFSVLTSVGLVPAAILGLDVVALLRGAADLTEHFRSAPPGENLVLDFVAVNHLWEQRGATTRVLSIWNKSLESVGYWYDQLLAESLGKGGKGALPLTTVNTRDLHSRAQQHQQGRRDKIFNNLIVDQWRFDPLSVGASEFDQDDLNRYRDRRVPQLMDAAIRGTNQALGSDRRPVTHLHLPKIDEYGLGQLFQMLMLATVVEGRLLGINPYGQPGVETYKRFMGEILRGEREG